MKKLLLILSPYLIFCIIFSLPFLLKFSKLNHKKDKVNNRDSLTIDSLESFSDTLNQEDITLDSLKSVDIYLDSVLSDKELQLNTLQDESYYKLIVGSFKSEISAKQLSDILKNEGFENRIIKSDDLSRVCAGFSNNEDELNHTKNSLESRGYKPWILRNS